MTGAANAARGKATELRVVGYLKAHGYPEARRSGRGFMGSDVLNVPWALEIKDRKAASWGAWCRQALAAAQPGQVVVVVRRTRGVTDVGQWEARWTLDGGVSWDAGQFGWWLVVWAEAQEAAG